MQLSWVNNTSRRYFAIGGQLSSDPVRLRGMNLLNAMRMKRMQLQILRERSLRDSEETDVTVGAKIR